MDSKTVKENEEEILNNRLMRAFDEFKQLGHQLETIIDYTDKFVKIMENDGSIKAPMLNGDVNKSYPPQKIAEMKELICLLKFISSQMDKEVDIVDFTTNKKTGKKKAKDILAAHLKLGGH